jgi:benzodiazapine receptor
MNAPHPSDGTPGDRREPQTSPATGREPGGRAFLALAAWIAVSLAAGAAGAIASANAPSFYNQLVKPAWAPPPWLFGPVWTALYVLMGFAAWLVWHRGPDPIVRRALRLFGLQLLLNALWTWIFFAWRSGGLALADILILWLLILATLASFWRVRPVAGALLLPYLAWVTFATALNAALWIANPGLL